MKVIGIILFSLLIFWKLAVIFAFIEFDRNDCNKKFNYINDRQRLFHIPAKYLACYLNDIRLEIKR